MKIFRMLAPAAVLLLLAGCITAKMVHPKPIQVPAGLTQAQVAKAVQNSLIGRRWMVIGSTSNSYTAKLTGNDWEATIRTVYDTKQVEIEYVDSKGLNHIVKSVYGYEIINRHWNSWMKYLTQDIQTRLAAEAHGH